MAGRPCGSCGTELEGDLGRRVLSMHVGRPTVVLHACALFVHGGQPTKAEATATATVLKPLQVAGAQSVSPTPLPNTKRPKLTGVKSCRVSAEVYVQVQREALVVGQ